MDEEEIEHNERDDEVFREFIEKLDVGARKLGLYVESARGQRMPLDTHVMAGGFDPIIRPFVTVTFMMGDEAFSDKVQNPQLYSDDAVLAQIEHATRASDADEIMRRYQNSGKLFERDWDEED